MYYLKYRPRTIKDLDNKQAKETITNILKSSQLPHAFLFVGQKGTGKTSSARIFAKAVNCLNNQFAGKSDSIEPCNECSNCTSIDVSSSGDVTELDAASNRGIEEIKSLIRESAFSPMSNRYRVFIIDEAHMITTEAFNALLKTLEEPPASVIFVLATTNEEKIPRTIVSRCFKVSFGRAKKSDVVSMLQRINEKEHLKMTDEVLEMIASHSERSFRDAAKMMEELVIQNKKTLIEAENYLGLRSKGTLLEVVQSKPVKEALKWIEEFQQSGGSIKFLIEQLLEDLRSALLINNGLTVDNPVKLSLSDKEIARLMKLLHESYTMLPWAPIESIPLEIAIVEFYNSRKS